MRHLPSLLPVLALVVSGACPRASTQTDVAADSGFSDAGTPLDGATALPDDAGGVDAQTPDAGNVSDAAVGPDAAAPADAASAVRNVILFIGDGMASEQARATRMYKNGDTAPLRFEQFPVLGLQRTDNASGDVTDSAASATAIATGVKVANGVISMRIPGDGAPLITALELHQQAGHRTGLITTDTPVTDATPAAFGAHEPARGNHAEIAGDYLRDARPALLLGPPAPGITPESAADAGYLVVQSLAELEAIEAMGVSHVSGQFDGTPPSLSAMTIKALELLSAGGTGFFLLVEHEGTDNGGHSNDLQRVVDSVLELEQAVAAAASWAEPRGDTLIVVTGDHETGGLTVTETAPQAGSLPAHGFSTGGHTGADVPVYAVGPGADALVGAYENTSIFDALKPSDPPPGP